MATQRLSAKRRADLEAKRDSTIGDIETIDRRRADLVAEDEHLKAARQQLLGRLGFIQEELGDTPASSNGAHP